ncbi:uncharacterized protein CLAFUR5_20023 [Fulvia fulva]|uniref:uncharacterized protein n=1 Tax=Passalora fulva TaxID=5499 RepID=UPI002852A8D5|nr:uncharacterized protein CLAFUR5_20023 [Fulvia fulva]KAK4630164.1 hypothetical protein CLAFUR0_20023 [Fulvia fulva]WMI38819.1 hypothetical protein CLAFUR5_20023 [Fulvia fulva]
MPTHYLLLLFFTADTAPESQGHTQCSEVRWQRCAGDVRRRFTYARPSTVRAAHKHSRTCLLAESVFPWVYDLTKSAAPSSNKSLTRCRRCEPPRNP